MNDDKVTIAHSPRGKFAALLAFVLAPIRVSDGDEPAASPPCRGHTACRLGSKDNPRNTQNTSLE